MRTRGIECYDYADSENPPVLHRKECFLKADHPLYGKFSRLTRQEEKARLLDNTATIGTRDGWSSRLRDAGFAVRGHWVLKLKQPAHTPAQSMPKGR